MARVLPGDDVVDIIGMDSYDQPEGRSFQEQIDEELGLQDHADFAREHGKPISFPEWGLFRNGDNPEYIRGMAEWIASNDTVYSTYTNYCPHGAHLGPESQCANPRSAAVLRELFSGDGAADAGGRGRGQLGQPVEGGARVELGGRLRGRGGALGEGQRRVAAGG